MLQQMYLGNTLQAWIVSAAAFAVIMAGLHIVKKMVLTRLVPRAKATKSPIDDLIVDLVRRSHSLVFLALAIYVATTLLTHVQPGIEHVIAGIAAFAGVVQAVIWGNLVITLTSHHVARRVDEQVTDPGLVAAVAMVARIILWSILLLLGLENLGVNINTLIAGLGIGGIAIGFALQHVLGDMFASFAILFDKPFAVGDFIVIDTFSGTVERVGIKTTRVRSITGEELVFANTDLVQGRIHNFKRMQERRVVFTIGVTYDTPPDQVQAIPAMLREIIEAQPGVRFDRAHFKDFGGSSLDFEIVYYVDSADYYQYMDANQAINLAILRRFNDLGIEFAFPSQTVYMAHS